MSDAFEELERKLQFPVVAISPAGWTKTADELGDLRDASPDDDLSEWQGMEIYDSASKRFVAGRAFRGWPKTRLGAAVCRLIRNSIHVAFELDDGSPVSVEALKERLTAVGCLEGAYRPAGTHREVIDAA